MAIQVNKALDLIQENIFHLSYEILPIENSIHRISAENIYAVFSMPRFNNSAMDGYGIKLKDIKAKIVDTILAGSNKETVIQNNQCVKIMTGARVPNSVEAIVPKELVELKDNEIILKNRVKKNQHIRFVGEDIKQNECIIFANEKINFSKITLLSSQGITHIKVYKLPKVTVFASGEELKLHYDKNIKNYQLYNSNTPTLIARSKELGCSVDFIGIAKDSIDSLKELIQNSMDSNLIITSGGVSVGDADFTKQAFDELGMKTIFDGIMVKPGKPTVLGKINNTIILNLPGNPLASQLIFELFGKIIIQKLCGNKNIFHRTIVAKLSDSLQNKKGRPTIIPGFFDGEYFIVSEKRSPGMVSVLSSCNSMIILDEKIELLNKNCKVLVLPIDWEFFISTKKDFITYAN